MKSSITFYIARHGKTEFNSLGKVQGWCDSPLTEEGKNVAHSLGKGLRDKTFSAVYVSDLYRAKHTAEILLESQGQTDLFINELSDFREACFGKFESGYSADLWRQIVEHLGYTGVEAASLMDLRKSVDARKTLNTSKLLDKANLAEDFNDVEMRTHRALNHIIRKEEKEDQNINILIISHVMAIRVMLDKFGGERLMTENYIDNASISKLIYDENEFHLLSVGDLSYVKKGESLLD